MVLNKLEQDLALSFTCILIRIRRIFSSSSQYPFKSSRRAGLRYSSRISDQHVDGDNESMLLYIYVCFHELCTTSSASLVVIRVRRGIWSPIFRHVFVGVRSSRLRVRVLGVGTGSVVRRTVSVEGCRRHGNRRECTLCHVRRVVRVMSWRKGRLYVSCGETVTGPDSLVSFCLPSPRVHLLLLIRQFLVIRIFPDSFERLFEIQSDSIVIRFVRFLVP